MCTKQGGQNGHKQLTTEQEHLLNMLDRVAVTLVAEELPDNKHERFQFLLDHFRQQDFELPEALRNMRYMLQYEGFYVMYADIDRVITNYLEIAGELDENERNRVHTALMLRDDFYRCYLLQLCSAWVAEAEKVAEK